MIHSQNCNTCKNDSCRYLKLLKGGSKHVGIFVVFTEERGCASYVK